MKRDFMMQDQWKSSPSFIQITFLSTELRGDYLSKHVKIFKNKWEMCKCCTTKRSPHLSSTPETSCLLNVASDLCLFLVAQKENPTQTASWSGVHLTVLSTGSPHGSDFTASVWIRVALFYWKSCSYIPCQFLADLWQLPWGSWVHQGSTNCVHRLCKQRWHKVWGEFA